ncbi:type II secretion system F family protein, partial [Planctomycetaceae bacterium]|nr:type II secretion system F family protein [Planctomycetaceae bacterium]
MPEFQYDARLASGQQTSGVLTAANEQDALGILSSRQLFPLRVMMSEESVKAAAKSQKRVSNKLLTGFYTKLADLLTAGVPLLRSLQLIIEQTSHSGLKSIIQDINDQVADGTRLAEAMAKHPKTFNDLVLSMVRAGEEGGFLEDVLKRVSSFNEHQEELKSRVVGAMIYPSFLCLAGASIVTVMMVVFVPKFAPIFSRMQDRGELPMATTTLLGFSEFLQSYWLIAIMALVGIGVAAQRWLDTDNGRDKFDMFRLKAWGIGIIVKNLAIARFCRILGTLLHNGVPILQALRIAKDATGNRVLSAAI